VKNTGLAPVTPLLPPRHLFPAHADVLLYPNEHEALMYELFDGKLLRRMRRAEREKRAGDAAAAGQRSRRDRITSLAWRAHEVELYSAHADGSVVAWTPRTDEDVEVEEEERDESRKRKRDVLEDIYAGLTGRNVTFGSMGVLGLPSP
jgi:DNA excision repair protein ERCC-8